MKKSKAYWTIQYILAAIIILAIILVPGIFQ